MSRTSAPHAPYHHELTAALRRWDGTSTAALTALHARYSHAPDFIAALVEATSEADTESAATWLIKHRCDAGSVAISEDLRATLYMRLQGFTGWAAQLHVLQCMDHLPVPDAAAPATMDAVNAGATSAKALIRAWSLYGAAQLATQHPAYRPQVHAVLLAAETPAPKGAVAVRLRKARALLDRSSQTKKD